MTTQRWGRFATLSAVLLVAGCEARAVSVAATNNANVNVEELFTHDGCTVYRFYDERYHYYTRCDGRPTTTTSSGHSESCGKNCTRWVPEMIVTGQKP